MEVELIVLYLEIPNPVSIIIKREVKDNCHVSGMGICVRRGTHIIGHPKGQSRRKSQRTYPNNEAPNH